MKSKWYWWIGAICLALIGVLWWIVPRQINQRLVGARTDASVSIDRIGHEPWNILLQEFVDEQGKVDYRRWSSEPESIRRLQAYLESLSDADPELPASQSNRLAFWINAYNALTIHGILLEYPTTSIRNHTSRLGGYHIWYDLLLWVGNQQYSLDQIEHQRLRKMGEPRIHFAIVCAARSCPRLRNQAYVGDSLDAQLDEEAVGFFKNDGNLQLSDDGKTLFLSSILRWFGQDFGSSTTDVIQAILPYFPAPIRDRMAEDYSVQYLRYDWDLNEQPSSE